MKKISNLLRQTLVPLKSQLLKRKLSDKDSWRTIAMFRDVQVWVSDDNKIEKAIFNEGDGYDYSNFSLIKSIIKPDYVCFDVGANIGIYSAVFSYMSGNSASVHSFEPVNHIRDRLKSNLKLNGFTDVNVNEFALGEREETIEMYQVKEGVFRGGTSSFLMNDNVKVMGEDKFIKCPVSVRLMDSYVESKSLTRLDFIKIDVEGFEWNVLNGARETVKKFRPYILMEYDEVRHGSQRREFSDYFREFNYKIYEFFIIAGTPVLKTYDFSRNPVHRNIICIP